MKRAVPTGDPVRRRHRGETPRHSEIERCTKFTIRLAVAAVAAVLAGSAYAWNEEGGEKDEALHLVGDPANGRDVYEVCSACHLPEGWGLPDGTFPQLAGQHHNVIIKQLADIRALNRDNPTMYPFALPDQIGGPQALADVVAYWPPYP